MYTLGQIDTTIDGLARNFPDMDKEKLRDLFYKTFSDKQIGLVRHLYHQAFVDNVEGADQKLKEMLEGWL